MVVRRKSASNAYSKHSFMKDVVAKNGTATTSSIDAIAAFNGRIFYAGYYLKTNYTLKGELRLQ